MLCYYIGFLLFAFIKLSNSAGVTDTLNPNWNATWTDKLKRDLLANYDKFARPTEYYNVTMVDLGLTIRHIDLDEMKSILTVYGWIKMAWKDPKLKWNTSDYGDLKMLHLADHEVWQPDIMLYNSATGSAIDHYGNSQVLVDSEGNVLWVPPSQFPVFCQLDLRYWPFDKQHCQLYLGSWTYSGNNIDLTAGFASIERSVENHEWEIKEVKTERHAKVYACCVEEYVDITFNIFIQRRSPMYETVVVSPATIIILLILATFWLPPLSGEKIFLNGITILLISFFLLYFAQKLPVMGMNTPLIVLFYSASLYLVAFSTIISIIVLNISRNKQAYAVPWFVKTNLDGVVGTILGLRHLYTPPPVQQRAEELRENTFEDHTTSEVHHMIQPSKENAIQHDWILLATAIDRIAFIVYCIVFIVLAFMYSV